MTSSRRLHSLTLLMLIALIFAALTLPNYAEDAPEKPTVIVEGTNYTDVEIQDLMVENAKWLLPGGKPNPELVGAGFTPQKTDMSKFNWGDRSAVLSLAERMVKLKKLHEQNLALAKLAKELTTFRAQYAAVVTKLIEQMTNLPANDESPAPDEAKSDDESALPIRPADKAEVNGTWPITLATLFGLIAFCLFVRERVLTARLAEHSECQKKFGAKLTVSPEELQVLHGNFAVIKESLESNRKHISELETQNNALADEVARLTAENRRLTNATPELTDKANQVTTTLEDRLAQLRQEFATYQLSHQARHDQLDANLTELNALLPIARQLARVNPDRADQILAGATNEKRVHQLSALLEVLLTGQINEAQFAALDGLQDEYVDARNLPAYHGKPAGMTELKVLTILRKLAEASRPPS